MPYEHHWVPPEVALEHKGVTVYCAYKDGEADRRLEYWFTTDEGEQQGEFDVRDIKLSIAEADEDQYAADPPEIAALKHAIDQGVITQKGLASE